jgi:uncharacterized protein YbbC (DUF1343 family)
VRAAQPEAFGWIPKHFDRLAGGPELRERISEGTDPAAIVAAWAEGLARFRERRRPFLLYPE